MTDTVEVATIPSVGVGKSVAQWREKKKKKVWARRTSPQSLHTTHHTLTPLCPLARAEYAEKDGAAQQDRQTQKSWRGGCDGGGRGGGRGARGDGHDQAVPGDDTRDDRDGQWQEKAGEKSGGSGGSAEPAHDNNFGRPRRSFDDPRHRANSIVRRPSLRCSPTLRPVRPGRHVRTHSGPVCTLTTICTTKTNAMFTV